MLDELKTYNLCYLGSPYRKYPHGMPMAAKQITKIAGRLFIHGIGIHSPISYGHQLSVYGGIHPSANDLWFEFNRRYMILCDALIVAKMDSWEISDGLRDEIEFFKNDKKPIYYLDPGTLAVSNAA